MPKPRNAPNKKQTPPPLEGGGRGEGSCGTGPLPPTPSLKGRGEPLSPQRPPRFHSAAGRPPAGGQLARNKLLPLPLREGVGVRGRSVRISDRPLPPTPSLKG